MKTQSNAILFYDEMVDWFSDEINHYLTEKIGDIVYVSPFVCDFEIVNKESEIVISGVVGDGLGYDLITKKLKIMEKGN